MIVSIIIVSIVATIPHIVLQFKSELPSRASDLSFSLYIITSGVLSISQFPVDELNFEFNIIGVSETKIISLKKRDFNPSIPGYVFEYVPTPLASHIDIFIV